MLKKSLSPNFGYLNEICGNANTYSYRSTPIFLRNISSKYRLEVKIQGDWVVFLLFGDNICSVAERYEKCRVMINNAFT
jgi:hypothetical protein